MARGRWRRKGAKGDKEDEREKRNLWNIQEGCARGQRGMEVEV